MDIAERRKRLRFRAWHRGTRECDILCGRFLDAHADSMDQDDCAWFEALFEEADQDIVAWITGAAPVPDAFRGPWMDRMQRLDHMKSGTPGADEA